MNLAISAKPNIQSNLETWLSFLERIHPKTIELGLERVTEVAQRLDVLKPAPYVFTVAGTNGKGTTCRALEMIFLAAGLRVGVYSSPHILRYNERVRINNQELPDIEHIVAFDKIERYRQNVSLTYFEYSTLAALIMFKQAKLDVVILEVGLGGRLDATNIVDADVAVITSIALDHIDYLGNTTESIGREKAGIFKPNCIAIVGEPNAPYSITASAKEKHVHLHSCTPNLGFDWQYQIVDQQYWRFQSINNSYDNLPIPKIPLANAATALAAINYSALKIDLISIQQGLANTALTGRFQVIQDKPLIIIDVAHNPHAAQYLNTQLQKLIMNRDNTKKVRLLIGMLKDKDIKSTLSCLHADYWYCASLYGERGAKANDIANNINQPQSIVYSFTTVQSAWQQVKSDADDDDIIVVCGSFYTVSDILGMANDKQ